MNRKYFKILACNNIPVKSEWREQLIQHLGYKPRRLSDWCELGLFGAVSCLPRELPSDVNIYVYTTLGAITATQTALSQIRDHLPMPFTFMQTQPSQLLNALGSALNWHGDGSIISSQKRHESEIYFLQTLNHSSLIGWVDESPEPISNYLWLCLTDMPPNTHWTPINSLFETQKEAHWLCLDNDQKLYQGVNLLPKSIV